MAFVLQFAPQDFVNIPKHGTIQYHPSLLPKYRGPSSINWPIIQGETEDRADHLPSHRRPRRRPGDPAEEDADQSRRHAGQRLFRPPVPDGRRRRCSKPRTWSSPGKHTETVQDESQASYEGWCRAAEAKIDWAKHVDHVYNLIRGCNPAPGAWTTFNGKKLQIFDCAQAPGAHLRRGEGQDRRGHATSAPESIRDHRAGRPDRSVQVEARERARRCPLSNLRSGAGLARRHDPRHLTPP